MLQRIAKYLLWFWVFLIPWQTRWIIVDPIIGGAAWEYGRVSLYAGDIIFIALAVIAAFLAKSQISLPEADAPLVQNLKSQKFGLNYILILIFFLWAGATLIWVDDRLVGFYYVLRFSQIVALWFIIKIIKPNLSLFLSALIASGAVQAGLAIAQFGFQYSPADKWLGLASHAPWELGPAVVESAAGRFLRAYGSLPHPNMLGGFLVFCLIAAAHYISRVSGRVALWLVLPVLVMSQALVWSFSRSAWLGLAFGFAVLILGSRGVRDTQKKFIVIFVLISSVFLANAALAPDLLGSRLAAAGRLEAQSIAERGAQAGLALEAAKSHLLGLGPGNYTVWLMQKFPNLAGYAYQPAHNLYLLALAELGIPGVIILAALAAMFLKFCRKNLLCLSLLAAAGIISLFDHYFWSSYSGILLLGLALILPGVNGFSIHAHSWYNNREE
ncbi:MAG: O-antigen ligase family protein [Patescibacteria group bacterium]|nr:O-antigen ligase family protein [Patescibacteria group bacterium]